METAQQYFTLSVCYLLVLATLTHPAQPSNVCRIRDRNASSFQVIGRCFEYSNRETWSFCAEYCVSYGGILAKVDEHTLTDDTAKKFAVGLTPGKGTNVHIGFTTEGSLAKWMDGTKVTVPDVDMMMPGSYGTFYVDNQGDSITYFWMALPAGALGRCLCEYGQDIDATTDGLTEETSGVSIGTTATDAHVEATTAGVNVHTTTTEVLVDQTSTGEHIDLTTKGDRADSSTTEVRVGQTSSSPPVEATTTSIAVDATTDVGVDTTTERIGSRPKTERVVRRKRRNSQRPVSAVSVDVRTKESAYIIGKAFSEISCGMVTMCSRMCKSYDQCVRFNYNAATGGCRLFDYKHDADQCFMDDPGWTVWDQT